MPEVGPCPCECNSGGFCGGCGHAGCGGRLSVTVDAKRKLLREIEVYLAFWIIVQNA
jgi:hypothetical protein